MWTKEKRTKGISYIAFSVRLQLQYHGWGISITAALTIPNATSYAGYMRILFLTLSVRQLARQPLVFCKRNSSFTAAWNFLKLSMY